MSFLREIERCNRHFLAKRSIKANMFSSRHLWSGYAELTDFPLLRMRRNASVVSLWRLLCSAVEFEACQKEARAGQQQRDTSLTHFDINIWQFINSMLCYAFIRVMMCQRFANNKTFTFYTIPTFCAFGKGQVFIIILLFSLFLSGTENHREEHIPPSSNTELFWKNRKSILNSYPLLFLNLIVILYI